jgi:glycosyltransferase involved in cell wall biosynthesis
MKILFFGTYDARKHPHVRVLQEGFELLGDEVLQCNKPLGVSTDERVRMLEQPWRAAGLIGKIGKSWRDLRRGARGFGDVDAVIVGYMGHFDVHLARRLFRTKLLVLDHMIFARDTAIDRGVRSGPLLAVLDRIDRAAVRAADIVCVDTEGHQQMLPLGITSIVVPLGATTRWFVEPVATGSGDRLRAIFHGSFTPLQGAPVLAEAIAMCAGYPIDFTMVGRGQELAAAKAAANPNPNVSWIDWMDPEELPELVASHDVCLGIFGSGSKAQRVVPHKVFEGAAAGCAIITAESVAQRRLLGGAAEFVPPNDPQAIADALLGLAKDRAHVEQLRKAARARAMSAFHPERIVEPLRARLADEMRHAVRAP